MNQIFILFLFYFIILFSIRGYGKLVTSFSTNDTKGIACSIGEQPIKGLYY